MLKRVYMKKRGAAFWLCKCDCGSIKLILQSCIISKKQKSCGCFNNSSESKLRGAKHPAWVGGRYNHAGYSFIRMPNHPNSSSNNYIAEHVLVVSDDIKRPLKKSEFIHHKNGIRNDNRIENLELWSHGHPSGQRVKDMITFCQEYLNKYNCEVILSDEALKILGIVEEAVK